MREKCMSNITVTTLFCSIYVLRYSRMSSVREKKIQFLKLILYTHALDFKFLKKCEYFRIVFTFFFQNKLRYISHRALFLARQQQKINYIILSIFCIYLGNLFMAKKIQFFGVFNFILFYVCDFKNKTEKYFLEGFLIQF